MTLLVLALLLIGPEQSTLPDLPCGKSDCFEKEGAIYTGLSVTETRALSEEWPDGSSNPDTWYEYLKVFDCPGNTTANPTSALCATAVNYCELSQPGSSGPYSQLFRRPADATGPIDPGTWEFIGNTCFTDAVPAQSGASPGLTEEMIIEQFHRTDFALPTTTMQPPGNRTLVNLPVFYELDWPEDGYSPAEVDTTTLIGHEVRIRPLLESATYDFGDGNAEGPTTSLGGPYPNGDITHTYTKANNVSPYIEVVYGGEVSVDGGDWTNIPASVTITGDSTPLEVLTSTNRLYDN